MAFCATIYLGYVANRQNERIVQMEEGDRLPILDLRLIDKCNSPHFHVIIIKEQYENPDNHTLCFECTNLTNIYICNITIYGYSLICGSHLISSSSPIRAEVSANSSLRPNEQKEMEITLPLGIYNNPDQASFDLIITVVGGTQYKETISFDLVGIPGKNYTSNKKIDVTPIQIEEI